MLWQFLPEGHGPHPGLAYKAGMGRKAKIDSKLDKVMCLPERRMGRFLYSSMMRCVAGVFGPLGLAPTPGSWKKTMERARSPLLVFRQERR